MMGIFATKRGLLCKYPGFAVLVGVLICWSLFSVALANSSQETESIQSQSTSAAKSLPCRYGFGGVNSLDIPKSAWIARMSHVDFLKMLNAIDARVRESWGKAPDLDEIARKGWVERFGTSDIVYCLEKNLMKDDEIWSYEHIFYGPDPHPGYWVSETGWVIVRGNKVVYKYVSKTLEAGG